ncbi:phage protein NinX family protein [Burkholderia cenocepacia]|uniref:phage protein NinX family protein n=1 Tax=Burkholderia cenocepacia TaxID=95486 RepID=UPI0013DF738C|nr:phage protein NinX family protein [Burkholderia cenocepacia]MCW3583945.1 DUF2591 domain-containing protein [Burkholderia cenocepacia]MCW3629616.1 DUF2591 domain-containing protein [Burkholderia cenocepacia]MCW5182644.1 DUF2591 domain-containing protein [Burkholderia cenocepacia]NGO98921.1 hypothetical protein [Burkholderia cenocepacia]
MKVCELSGMALDYWACRALLAQFEGQQLTREVIEQVKREICSYPFRPSTDWVAGGPIIEREPFGIFERVDGGWAAGIYRPQAGMRDLCVAYQTGETLLIAAMRAYVASKFGDEVPDAPT